MHLFGHIVTVDTVNELKITVQTKLTLTGEATKDDIKKEIEILINNYFLELKKEWEVNDSVIVRLSRIDTILLNAAGVIDVSNTVLNGQAMNIALDKFQIPILEGVVLL
nr:MAG TPA: Baseplate J like protein [Caudoviricetes sp.]